MWDERHLVQVPLVAPLSSDHPEIAGVTDPGAVPQQRLFCLFLRFHEHDRAVELARAHETATEGLLDVAPQPRTHVARDLDALIRLDSKLLDSRPVTVVAFFPHRAGENSAICSLCAGMPVCAVRCCG